VTVIGDVKFFYISRRDWNPVSFISLSTTIEFDIEPKSLMRVVVVQWILQERRESQSRVWFFSRTPLSLVTSVNTHVLVNYSKSRAFSLTKRICKTRRNKMKIFQKNHTSWRGFVDDLHSCCRYRQSWPHVVVAWIQSLNIENPVNDDNLFVWNPNVISSTLSFFYQRYIWSSVWYSV